ncbi:hypothetical protein [Methyloferula stellata]|uniref:hypothetical protein n=1 Tax=Methyloferula stellata TaxID=876270 RepID=UPI00037E52EF|nr:hypothetical protein [Methyloferula stellata]
MTDRNYSTQPTVSAEKARQGEIILRTRTQRIIFFGGLVAIVVFGALLQFVHLS